eukprot:122146_1
MPTTYKVGDVLLCHKHIGVAKFVGKLHGQDYKQLPSKSQVYIKKSDIWIGLQLAEQPNINNLTVMKPHHKHKKLKSISYECLNTISFLDYFTANYGILIPKKYIHKKITVHQILTKLTQLFHTFKKTQKRNIYLTQKIAKLKTEMQTIQKVKSTSQKSLESIIYDQNGNSYHHHQKITHTTTHSYKSFNKKKKSKTSSENEPQTPNSITLQNDDAEIDHNSDKSTIISIDTNEAIKNTQNKKRNSQKNNNSNIGSDSLSDKAVDGVKDNQSEYSDRNMSDEDDNVVNNPPTFSPDKVIKIEEDDNNIVDDDNIERDINGNRLSHARRYSAPWDNKKLNRQEFGSISEKINNPYWKNSGNRFLDNNTNTQSKHHRNEDSTELNMLPMIKEDPTNSRIYRMSKVQHNQQNIREKHKRSMSMSVVNVPRYFFEIDDHEYPDLPDL